jgi:hypothetical protein
MAVTLGAAQANGRPIFFCTRWGSARLTGSYKVYSELICGSRWPHFHNINRTMFHRHCTSEI